MFIAENREHYQRWFTLGRSMIVLLSVLGGLALCSGRELFGDRAGVLAALFWACEPNLIAHGSLVTTDMGAAAFFVFASIRHGDSRVIQAGDADCSAAAFWDSRSWPSSRRSCSIRSPCSCSCSLLFLICLRSRAIPHRGARWPIRAPGLLKISAMWIAAFALSVAVWNAGYLFRGSFATVGSYQFQSGVLKRIAARLPMLARLPVPLPRDYVAGLDHQRQIMEQKHPVYLDGQWREEGFAGYYAWAPLYKLPHALQLLDLLVLLWLVMPAGCPRLGDTSGHPVARARCAGRGRNVAHAARHPLRAACNSVCDSVRLAGGRLVRLEAVPRPHPGDDGVAALMVLSIRYHPEHLSYFNELAGGPLGGPSTCSTRTSTGDKTWAD